MNIFAEMLHSIYDLDGYKRFLKNSGAKTFLYGLVLSLICALATWVIPACTLVLSAGGIRETVEALIPDFTLKDGKLWVGQTMEYSDYNVCLWIDTESEAVEELQEIDLLAFDKALVLGKEHMIVKTDGEAVRSTYREMGLGDWDQDLFLDTYLPYIEAGFWSILVIGIWSVLTGFFLSALLLAMAGSFLAAGLGCRLRFGDLFRLAVHARTAPLLLKSVLSYVPLAVPFFFVINLVLSLWYMRAGIRSVKQEAEEEISGSADA